MACLTTRLTLEDFAKESFRSDDLKLLPRAKVRFDGIVDESNQSGRNDDTASLSVRTLLKQKQHTDVRCLRPGREAW